MKAYGILLLLIFFHSAFGMPKRQAQEYGKAFKIQEVCLVYWGIFLKKETYYEVKPLIENLNASVGDWKQFSIQYRGFFGGKQYTEKRQKQLIKEARRLYKKLNNLEISFKRAQWKKLTYLFDQDLDLWDPI